ncbi:NAD(P)/FAD-dependent oxidoreductase [Sporolactobacillus sp. Y61]|uniref:Ferredoxin--NADP reductase n=1 Tax=Sporolactobacillus sp. Y61 TaxID=3160863 RepID=A0AAU8IGJ9_9BACL
MTENKEIFDTTIIGGGPIGLFSAFYAGLRQMKVRLIESLPQVGGQLKALYPEKTIFDVAGFPSIKAKELVSVLTKQTLQFDPAVILGQKVEKLKRLPNGVIELQTKKGEKYLSRTVIITAGVGAFSPRLFKVENVKSYEHDNLYYYVHDIQQFAGQSVVILGGGDSAVDWANALEPIAAQVTVVHRRNAFRAHESSVRQMKQSNVKIATPFTAKAIVERGKTIEKLIINEVKGDREMELPLDDLIVNYGFVSELGPIKDWKLTLDKNSIIVNSKMETNIPGVYAAGDIVSYPGKVKLIATGFGEAPVAVNNAKHFIDPNARTQPMHSSSSRLFGQ